MPGLSIPAPQQGWGSEITSIRLRPGWLSLVALLDRVSRDLVRGALEQTLALAVGLEALADALRGARATIWNSDQGSHFTSPPYTRRWAAARVKISMDGKGRALDNIFTERPWRTIKYEEVYLKDYQSLREARQNLTTCLSFSNRERPHQSLDDRTPAAVYFAAPSAPAERENNHHPGLLEREGGARFLSQVAPLPQGPILYSSWKGESTLILPA